MNLHSFDLVIIGGGSAGYAAARTGHEQGLRVAVVDGAKELGGLCILRGCMPSKALIASSNRARFVRGADTLAIQARYEGVDALALRERKRKLIGEFAQYRQEQLGDGRFELIRGWGKLLSQTQVEVSLREGGSQILEAKAILLATGSVINWPKVEGLRESEPWTSDEVLDADRIPESVIVLGGGPIACELACFYEGLGARVTQLQRSGQILTDADEDLAHCLAEAMRERGIDLQTGVKMQKVERLENGHAVVSYEQNGQQHQVQAEQVVASLGRRPATEGLGLETAGIVLQNGRPKTDASQRCEGTENIWAAGDLPGPWELVHVAISQAEIATRNIARKLGKLDGQLEHSPTHNLFFGVFTEPEYAQVGLTEREASKQGVAVEVASYPFNDHGKSMLTDDVHGFVKLLVEKQSRVVVGAAMVGPHATDLLHSMALAVHLKLRVEQLVSVPWYHPTLHEIWSYPVEELAGV